LEKVRHQHEQSPYHKVRKTLIYV